MAIKPQKYNQLITDLEQLSTNFIKKIQGNLDVVHIYTHLDADGLSSGAIIGKALFRERIPFKISILRQLEREEIEKIKEKKNENYIIFTDFGSGQYLELQNSINQPFLILDHHLPQKISNKEEREKIIKIYNSTNEWQINPYFYDIDGSTEISGAGMSYLFAKCLNKDNIDLSVIAIVGAIGDVQNQGTNKSFFGINSSILKEAIDAGLIEIVNDINLSPLKPLNESLAYSKDINLPGISGDINKSLKFLKKLGILMEKNDGTIRTLTDLNQEEKQRITSAIIEYASLKMNIEPQEIINNLIVNRYLLLNEEVDSILYDASEFSNLLNACGRTNNASIGIAIAMGDRKEAYEQAQINLENYKKSLVNALNWIKDEEVIKELDNIQILDGRDIIPENIIGTISSMLIFDDTELINKNKPLFGYSKRKDEAVYKVSARAHESIVKRGVNLSHAIREALELSNLIALGGGHPPAAGTKIPIEKIEEFLSNCDIVIQNQLLGN